MKEQEKKKKVFSSRFANIIIQLLFHVIMSSIFFSAVFFKQRCRATFVHDRTGCTTVSRNSSGIHRDTTLFMNLLMTFQVTLYREGSVTPHTFKWFLPSVAVTVNLQTTRTRERFSTTKFQALISMALRARHGVTQCYTTQPGRWDDHRRDRHLRS